MRPLLVGEMNEKDSDPRAALSLLPPGGSGGRLAKILGLSAKKFLHRFDRVNLCSVEWDPVSASVAALTILSGGERRVLILLGHRVASAFGIKASLFEEVAHPTGARILVLPHPSGRCRIWNDQAAALRARKLVDGVTRRR